MSWVVIAGDIWFCGDNHSRFHHIIDAVKRHRPSAIVLLGDVQAKRPLQVELAEILSITETFWIAGNHDADTVEDHDNLFLSELANRNLHGRVVNVCGVRIAGLAGVFRERVWMPPGEPTHASAKEFLRVAGKGNRWRGGLPLRHRTTIFPDDYYSLARARADVLVTHEAPGAHPQGHEALTLLAAAMGVQAHFHGHTHDCVNYGVASAAAGFAMIGVGLCGITQLSGLKIISGELDDARSNRREWT